AIRRRFLAWQQKYPVIGDVRGLGAMVAMELVKDRASKAPNKELTGKLQAEALKRGVILLSAGTLGNVIRVLVPLTVEDAVLAEGLDAMEAALAAVAAS
ncbi:MAG: aminotransferase class III-fold pyridoxal phosphate-dependent enzyme, partial [Gemmatimonadales bacterium]